MLPYCRFVQGFIDRHREYLDLVPVERRPKFALADGCTSLLGLSAAAAPSFWTRCGGPETASVAFVDEMLM